MLSENRIPDSESFFELVWDSITTGFVVSTIILATLVVVAGIIPRPFF